MCFMSQTFPVASLHWQIISTNFISAETHEVFSHTQIKTVGKGLSLCQRISNIIYELCPDTLQV